MSDIYPHVLAARALGEWTSKTGTAEEIMAATWGWGEDSMNPEPEGLALEHRLRLAAQLLVTARVLHVLGGGYAEEADEWVVMEPDDLGLSEAGAGAAAAKAGVHVEHDSSGSAAMAAAASVLIPGVLVGRSATDVLLGILPGSVPTPLGDEEEESWEERAAWLINEVTPDRGRAFAYLAELCGE